MGVRTAATVDLAHPDAIQNWTFSTNESSDAIEMFGVMNVGATGDFGGGTLALEKSFDGGTTWFTFSISTDGTPTAWTGDFLLGVEEAERGNYYRLTLSGATAPSITTRLSSNFSPTGR